MEEQAGPEREWCEGGRGTARAKIEGGARKLTKGVQCKRLEHLQWREKQTDEQSERHPEREREHVHERSKHVEFTEGEAGGGGGKHHVVKKVKTG